MKQSHIKGQRVNRETINLLRRFFVVLMLTTAPHMPPPPPPPALLPSVPINPALSSCHARRHRQALSPAATGRQRSKSLLKPAVVDSTVFSPPPRGRCCWGRADGGPPLEPTRTTTLRVSSPLQMQRNQWNISL